TRTERSEGEGWSRAREKRPPERNQRLRGKARTGTNFVPVLAYLCISGLFQCPPTKIALFLIVKN
ncbi:hypothetical protein DEX24_09805, partial [Kurthia sibirica]